MLQLLAVAGMVPVPSAADTEVQEPDSPAEHTAVAADPYGPPSMPQWS